MSNSATRKAARRKRQAEERRIAIRRAADRAYKEHGDRLLPEDRLDWMDNVRFPSKRHAELLGTLLQVQSRVRDHIQRMDDGAWYAVDDLAVALRVLLCSGNGGHVLQRFIKTFGLQMPTIHSSLLPIENAIFAVGNLPIAIMRDGMDDDRYCRMSLGKWLSVPALRMRLDDGKQVTLTWDAYIRLYANKFGGAHADDVIPEELPRVDMNGVGQYSLGGYILRQIGEFIWFVCQIYVKMGVQLFAPDQEIPTVGGIGAHVEEPSPIYDHGHLQWFFEGDDEIAFLWYVDDGSDRNRMRLFFEGRAWDFTHTVEDKLRVFKFDDPVSKFRYQSPFSPNYANQADFVRPVGDPKFKKFIWRTFQDLDRNKPFRYEKDHDFYSIPGWVRVGLDGETTHVDTSELPAEFYSGNRSAPWPPRGPSEDTPAN